MNNQSRSILLIIGCLTLSLMVGCRGIRSDKTPIHLNPNMDWGPQFEFQEKASKPPVDTVPFGSGVSARQLDQRPGALKADPVFYQGKTSTGAWVDDIPMDLNMDVMKRGQERYNIYCSVCHTQTGNGTKSLIAKRGWIASDITQSLTRSRSDGELFDIVSNGIRTMPGYAHQLNESDRWAIVAYVRALQRAYNSPYSTLPKDLKNQLK